MRNRNPEWLGEADSARSERVERALNVAGAGTTLLQVFINRVVQQLVLRKLGVFATMERAPGQGDAAYINRRAPGATSAEWVADTDSGTEDTGDYTQVAFVYRTLLTRGKVTRKLQATGRSYGDVLGMEVSGKTDDFQEILEDGLIVGDNAADAKQISGLLTLIGAVATQVIANTTAAAGSGVVLDKLDEAIDVVKGDSMDLLIYASDKGARLINAALQQQQEFENMTEIAAGFRVRTYDDIPIVKCSQLPDDMTWDGSALLAFSGESSNPTTAIIVVNTTYIWIEELTPITVMPLAKDNSQYDQFDIFWDGSLVHSNTLGGSILGGLAT